jgi:predicted RNA-binding protein associated with RNAse of E/G family
MSDNFKDVNAFFDLLKDFAQKNSVKTNIRDETYALDIVLSKTEADAIDVAEFEKYVKTGLIAVEEADVQSVYIKSKNIVAEHIRRQLVSKLVQAAKNTKN